ncbi:hypothetical protein Tco_0289492 [Tanacetum coccineum]
MYDSWESRIRLFIKGKKHGRMMLDSIDNGLLVYPTVEENGQTRPKKYSELTKAQQLQDECDVQATNIILHGLPPDVYALVNHQEVAKLINDMHTIGMTMQQVQVNTKFLNALPSEWSKFVTDVKYPDPLSFVANSPTLYNPSQSPQHSGSLIYTLVTQQSQVEFPQLDFSLVVHMFQQGEDLIECINKAMTFLSVVASRRRAYGETVLVKTQEAGQILDKEQLAFLADPDCDDLSSAKAVLIINLSSCDPEVLYEVPYSDSYPNDMINQDVQEMQYYEQTHVDDFEDNEIHSGSNIISYSQYLQESQDAVIQDTNPSAPNKLLVLSLIEKNVDHVAHLDKENQTNKMVNESLTAELERYKERITIFEQRLNQEIDTLKETLSNNVKEKESLSKTLTVFKTESKEKESKKLKGKNVVNTAVSKPNATIALGISKLDIEPISSRIKNNRDADKQTDSLKTKDSNKPLLTSIGVKPMTSASGYTKNNRITRPPRSNQKNKVEYYSRNVKSSLNKTSYVSEPISNTLVKHSMRNAKFESICAICNKYFFDANHDICLINVHSKSKSKRNKIRKAWKPTGKVFIDVGYKWKPTRKLFPIVGNSCPLTRITAKKIVHLKETTSKLTETPKLEIKVYSKRPKPIKSVGSSKKAKIVESKIANNSEPNHLLGSNAIDVPSSSSLVNDMLS